MLPVVWSQAAEDDLVAIVRYIAERNPRAAGRLYTDLLASTWPLPEHPYLFKQSERVPGCREIVIRSNYVLLYRIETDQILVVAVVHSRQQFPQ